MDCWFNSTLYHLVLISAFLVTFTNIICCATDDDRKVHVVFMGSLPDAADYSPSSHHYNLLQEVLDSSSSVADALLRSYTRSFNGFAAKLTDAERERLARRSEVVSIFPSRTLRPHTTRSWDFMSFPEKSMPSPSVGSDVIIGILDSGIWPDSDSFSGLGFPPPPPKWKGACSGGKDFYCNNKLIGARVYTSDKSALDIDGHGTHVASTAAGNSVSDASFFGVAQGTARGGAPSARIAIYKVCLRDQCEEDDILAAFDDAISDGVDIISVSLGFLDTDEFIHSSLAIGSFHAMARNILTVQAAGNSGNNRSSISSIVPWIFTVAASNTDRRIINKVVLSNGKTFFGNSVNSFSLSGPSFPLISGEQASRNCSAKLAKGCKPGCLDSTLVSGKIVVCNSDSNEAMNEILTLGAVGAIVPHISNNDHSTIVPYPASSLSKEDFMSIMDYLNSNKYPQAVILKSEGMKLGSPPQVASFSSRGPNKIIPDILKPDISAPGVDIVAAYSIFAPLSDLVLGDIRKSAYSVMSGTSMACPHTTGVVAYVKSLHPDWSASAIKSAVMTTAWPMKDSDNEFAYGAGHINPVNVIDPGLVYESTVGDYVEMLCGVGFNKSILLQLSGNNISCPLDQTLSPRDLNYPSLTACVERAGVFKVQFRRVVTNVGYPTSVYNSRVISNSSMKISVAPNTLLFTSVGEKQEFTFTVSGTLKLNMLSATLIWSDSAHTVRSPVVVYTNNAVVYTNNAVCLGVYVGLKICLQIIGLVLLL